MNTTNSIRTVTHKETQTFEPMTPELKEKAILEALWKVLKEHEVTYDGAIRIAVRLIISYARGSDSAQEAFDYAKRLLTRSIAREVLSKANDQRDPRGE